MRAARLLSLKRGTLGLPRTPLRILMWGQSNGAAIPVGTLGQSEISSLLGPDLLSSNEAGTFAQMGDGAGNFRGNGSSACGGQVLTRLMRRIANASGQTVRAWAHCYTGQGIEYFLPGSVTRAHYTDGTQHASKNNYTLLTDAITGSAITPDLMIHFQGEANSVGMDQPTYYANLRALWEARHALYPAAHLLIWTTLTGGASNAIAAAQAQLASEEPMVHLVDTRDMFGNTAFWAPTGAGEHYSNHLGYDRAADRGWAVLQRAARDDVPSVDHIEDLSSLFTHFYSYRHSLTGLSIDPWQPNVGTDSLVSVSGYGVPRHVVSDSAFGGRTSARFRSGKAATLTDSITQSGIDWTWFGTVRLGNVGADMCLFSLRDPDGSNHSWTVKVKTGGDLVAEYGGSEVGSGVQLDLDAAQTIGVVIDGTGVVARLYVNGALASTVALPGTQQNPTAPVVWVGSRFGTSQFFDGWIHSFSFGNAAATTPQIALSHAWSAEERTPS